MLVKVCIIATAAHVLYDNGWTTNNYFYVPEVLPDGKIGIQTLGTKHYFNEVHINNNYYLSGDSANDYALIVVDDDSLSDCYHFDLGIPYNMYQLNSHFSSFNIFVTGYPGDAHSAHPVPNSNLLNHYYYLTSAYGGLHNVSGQYSSNLICYTTDTIWGDSGSPVYVKETITTGTTTTEYITVVGIHIGENLLTLPLDNSNFGVPMTPIRLRFYLNNPYI